ncbi:MAG: LysR family transcriptional regulator [Silicimonas sp.]|nr:LysR family transcriptional regulator [Silicimonas sp.]
MLVSHLNGLRALEATLRLGSFTAAATELGVTPAAVGQRVRTLEEYLGQGLFIRTPSGIKPKEELLRIEAQLTNSFSGLAAAMTELKKRNPSSRLSVTLPASFVENWLTSLISEFYQRHASVDLRLDACNRDVDLMSENFDFAVRYGAPPAEHLQGVALFEDHVLPVCSPGFAQEYVADPSVRSLENTPLIHISNRTSDPSWVGFDEWGRAFGFDCEHLDHGVHFTKVSSGLQSAIAGQGLVLCGLVEAFNSIRSGLLVAPFGPEMSCKTDGLYRLLWASERPLGRLQSDFKEWLLAKAATFTRDMETFLREAGK